MPRALRMTRRAISPLLATNTDPNTVDRVLLLIEAAGQALACHFGQGFDDAGVVFGGGVQAQAFQGGGAAVTVGGAADEVVERVDRADDPAADRRLGVVAPAGPALA